MLEETRKFVLNSLLVMMIVHLSRLFSAAAPFLATSADTLRFDPSNPKILIGLVIGGSIPYFTLAVPAVFTKWLLFKAMPRLAAQPKFSRLCAVGVMEVFCYIAAIWTSFWLRSSIPFFISLLPLILVNLLLFETADEHVGSARSYYVKKAPYALGMGLLYFGYILLATLIRFAVRNA